MLKHFPIGSHPPACTGILHCMKYKRIILPEKFNGVDALIAGIAGRIRYIKGIVP